MTAKQKQIKKANVVRAKVTRHAKRVLVPHKGNGYRPHLIRVNGLTAVLAVALLAQIVYGFVTTGHFEVLSRVSDISTVELLADTNAARAEEGIAELQLNEQLSQAAFLKAQDMFNNDYWAHTSPSGVEPWKWLGEAGYNYSVAGENLAKNYPTAAATVDAWMNSESHRTNIMNSKYNEVGFAVVDGTLGGRNTTLVVAFYGAPVTATAVQSTSQAPSSFNSATGAETANPLAYFGSAIQSLSPVTISMLGLLAIVAIVGAAAHHYRDKFPKSIKKSWKMHQGLYAFWGMIALGVLIIIATGGGQI